MSRRAGMRDRWVEEVCAADYIGDACRVALLIMASRMTDTGRVSLKRQTIANVINRHEPRVAERIREAVDAGLLSKVGGGYKGMTSIYEAIIPARIPNGLATESADIPTVLRYPSAGTLRGGEILKIHDGRAVHQRARVLTGVQLAASPDVTKEDISFEQFWTVYPKQTAKGAAKAAYTAALKKTTAAVLLQGARNYRITSRNTDPQYLKLPHNWLADERWTDAPPPTPKPSWEA